jgi:hypothetical protein
MVSALEREEPWRAAVGRCWQAVVMADYGAVWCNDDRDHEHDHLGPVDWAFVFGSPHAAVDWI